MKTRPATRWKVPGQVFRLHVDLAVWSSLQKHCRQARNHEVGGVLLGRYSEDGSLAQVLEAPDPAPDTQAGPTWLVRGSHGLRALLLERWEAQPRLHYLGEWHYHPSGRLEPSPQDLKQMRLIASRSQYQCPEPIMILVGRSLRNSPKSPPVRVFVFPDGEPLEYRNQSD